ncbi:DUF445 domain-containing protein [Caenispirillum bisanense]|uniref:DUF445 domain-containing protein n=1 Tax=Caenispirillum bisanense TaxID=414052 RepID=UPI0031E1BB9A
MTDQPQPAAPMPAADSAETEEQRRALRRYRMGATGLLVAMGGIFVGSHFLPGQGTYAMGLLQAGTEAALVGGLADWFAVTALFRRPLGLPIPHTALIPSNHERIARRLGRFVTRWFLAPEVLEERLKTLHAAQRLGSWLIHPDNSRTAARRIAELLPAALSAAGDERLRALVQRSLTARLRQADVAPLLGQLLAAVPDEDFETLLTQGVSLAREQLVLNEARIHAIVTERSAWWLPKAVDRRVAKTLIAAAFETLDDLEDPDNDLRRRLTEVLRDFRERLRTDPELHARIRSMKNGLLRHPQVQEAMARAWDDLRRTLVDGASRPDSRLRLGLEETLLSMGRRLLEDADLRRAIDERVEAAVAAVLVPWREEIGRFIEDVVRRWDTATLTERLELTVGRDLQFIRVNGTLVGALVGCLLYVAVEALT